MSTLLVCSVGGHLTQLRRLLPTIEGIEADRQWVTYDTPQSRSMLAGEQALFLEYAGPRDARRLLRHAWTARTLFPRGHTYTTAISTGSGIALAFLPIARAHGCSCHYIESFTRSDGPSLTGKLLSRVPGIALYTQYPALAGRPWRYAGSVFDSFAPGPRRTSTSQIGRLVVTLGTMRDYSFRRLVERVLAIAPANAEILWQVGCTDVSGLSIAAVSQLPSCELRRAIGEADVVIAHAGCGSAITALELGKAPVLVPREAAHGENVDDHQRLLAEELDRRGLAVVRRVEQLTADDLLLSAGLSIQGTASVGFPLHRSTAHP